MFLFFLSFFSTLLTTTPTNDNEDQDNDDEDDEDEDNDDNRYQHHQATGPKRRNASFGPYARLFFLLCCFFGFLLMFGILFRFC
jgi:hypothetical protein